MALLALGINHKTAPVSVRERIAFSPQGMTTALYELSQLPDIQEAAILSTCNRTEVYCGAQGYQPELIRDWLGEYHQLPREELNPYIYTHPDQDAVRHMLRVASGLDSLVLGEPQILGQMKGAFQAANDAGTLGRVLGRLFQHTFAVAKQVRTDTAIGASAVSVAFAAVNLARQIFGDLRQATALLIGAGDTIELAARHLHEQGIQRMIVANRTAERAHLLASQFGGYAITLGEIRDHLAEADLVISSTASPLPILGKGTVESAVKQRRHKPMLMVDIAVPRDIEAEVSQLSDIYLYTVDDLHSVIEENLRSRKEAAKQAEEIIDVQADRFMEWIRSLDATEVIQRYREDALRARDDSVEKALRMIRAGRDPEAIVQQLGHTLTNRLMHCPSACMRRAGAEGRKELLQAARELFQLKD